MSEMKSGADHISVIRRDSERYEQMKTSELLSEMLKIRKLLRSDLSPEQQDDLRAFEQSIKIILRERGQPSRI